MSPQTQRKHTVLLVEDNLPDDLLVREVIRSANLPLEVHSVTDGAAAVDAILGPGQGAEPAETPELLILDLNLPKLEGFEVLERIRANQHSKDLPVLIVTSSDAPADRQRAAQLGARYFRKPPSYEAFFELATVLKKMLAEHGMT
jgi:two-component system, response regulator